MSRFFVGQRVKVVRVKHSENRAIVGLECRISEIDESADPTMYGLESYPIGYRVCGYDFVVIGFSAFHLEPILPEGHQPATQSHEQLMADLRKGMIHA